MRTFIRSACGFPANLSGYYTVGHGCQPLRAQGFGTFAAIGKARLGGAAPRGLVPHVFRGSRWAHQENGGSSQVDHPVFRVFLETGKEKTFQLDQDDSLWRNITNLAHATPS